MLSSDGLSYLQMFRYPLGEPGSASSSGQEHGTASKARAKVKAHANGSEINGASFIADHS